MIKSDNARLASIKPNMINLEDAAHSANPKKGRCPSMKVYFT